MSAKTLNVVEVFNTAAFTSRDLTYSIAPAPAAIPTPELPSCPVELQVFLENDNPLGCVRGVFWVMAFNAIVFLTVFSAWATFKYLL